MLRRPRLAATCVLAACASFAHAAETPLSVYQAALTGNAAYRAVRAGTEADREAINIAFGALLPNLSISSVRNRNQVDRSLGGGAPERFDYASASDALTLRQPLYRPGSLAAWDQAKAQADASESDALRARGELAVKALSTYFDAAFTDDVDGYLQAQKAAAAAQVEAATRGLKAGSGTRIDIDEARSRLDLLLAQEIDLRVVSKVIEVLQGPDFRGRKTRFFVNLSRTSISDPHWVRRFQSMLAAAPIDHSQLVFEITETAAMSSVDVTQEFIAQMKGMGCRFALDDFGAGFSSFYFLKRFDVDYLKIDGSFVRDLASDNASRLFVRALCDVARGLNKQVVAEWVEDQSVMDILVEMGVQYGQGFLFARPLPFPAVVPVEQQLQAGKRA